MSGQKSGNGKRYPKLTPVRTAGGQCLYVTVLRGNAQGGTTRLMTCECGEKVGWVLNEKTGRSYVCGTMPTMNPDSSRQYVCAWAPHRCEGGS